MSLLNCSTSTTALSPPPPLFYRSEACKNEVTLMQRLQHPNIVAYKESFFANGQDSLCIVMTFCDGGDLAGRLAAAKGALFKEDQILHWFVQLCLAIHYMHENRVLHRVSTQRGKRRRGKE